MKTEYTELPSTIRASGLIGIKRYHEIKAQLETMTDDQRELYLKGIIKQCAPIARRQRGG